jgi:hypothetical protein
MVVIDMRAISMLSSLVFAKLNPAPPPSPSQRFDLTTRRPSSVLRIPRPCRGVRRFLPPFRPSTFDFRLCFPRHASHCDENPAPATLFKSILAITLRHCDALSPLDSAFPKIAGWLGPALPLFCSSFRSLHKECLITSLESARTALFSKNTGVYPLSSHFGSPEAKSTKGTPLSSTGATLPPLARFSPYLFTSSPLLASQPPWCQNDDRHEMNPRPEETSPPALVSKDIERISGSALFDAVSGPSPRIFRGLKLPIVRDQRITPTSSGPCLTMQGDSIAASGKDVGEFRVGKAGSVRLGQCP